MENRCPEKYPQNEQEMNTNTNLLCIGGDIKTPTALVIWVRPSVFATQAEAARYLNLDPSTTSRYESGMLKPDIKYIAFLILQLERAAGNLNRDSGEVNRSYRDHLLSRTNEIIANSRAYGLRSRFRNWEHLQEIAEEYECKRRKKGGHLGQSDKLAAVAVSKGAEVDSQPIGVGTDNVAAAERQGKWLFMLLPLLLLVVLILSAFILKFSFAPSESGIDEGSKESTPNVNSSATTSTGANTPTSGLIAMEATHTQRPSDSTAVVLPSATAASTGETDRPTSEPLGKGDSYQGQGLSIELTDYEIRSQNDPDDEAVSYTLLLSNETGSDLELEFSLSTISAIDNFGTEYIDSASLAALWYEESGQYACICVLCASPTFDLERHQTIPAYSAINLNLYLNMEGTAGNCSRWGMQQSRTPFVGRSRVTLETNYIDLKIPSIKYRTNQLQEVTNLAWRLTR